MTNDEILDKFISSEGDIRLTHERVNKGLPKEAHVTEYGILSALANSEGGIEEVMRKLRTLASIKLFSVLMEAQRELSMNLDSLRPSELARTYSSLASAFAQMTSNISKETFDFDAEAMKLAEEFQIDKEEIKSELKSSIAKSKVPS